MSKHLFIIFGAASLLGQNNPPSLKTLAIPQPTGLAQYVKDSRALAVLGKALFWDMQAGSDGTVACATCHFHAGADHRAQNQLSNAFGAFPVNHTFAREDFPFRSLQNPANRNSAVLRDSSAVAGSAGLFRRIFVGVDGSGDDGYDLSDAPGFRKDDLNTRRVTARNSPSVINSVFSARNFWDGRASNVFTGATPFGDSDTRNNLLVNADGVTAPQRIRMTNASLASQAVGPALNNIEMSYDGRTWPMLGSRLLGLRPLPKQRVAPDDSILGAYASDSGPGLLDGITYLSLVQAAFQPQLWNGESTQAEANFAVFWGLAIQAYESTLVSDDAPYDRFASGTASALTAEQQNGLRVFQRVECQNCHGGATFANGGGRGRNGGFFRTGVRPAADDIGLAGKDDFGLPLSNNANVAGFFKTPTLRNVEFTGPYFHNGGQATLEEVVEFYNRGGDFTGNVDGDVQPRNLSAADKQALVAFMKSLSDDRVKYQRAPFDHPELCVSAGQAADDAGTLLGSPGAKFAMSANDKLAWIPMVGSKGTDVPLQTFEELLTGVGADGSRAHSLTQACPIL